MPPNALFQVSKLTCAHHVSLSREQIFERMLATGKPIVVAVNKVSLRRLGTPLYRLLAYLYASLGIRLYSSHVDTHSASYLAP